MNRPFIQPKVLWILFLITGFIVPGSALPVDLPKIDTMLPAFPINVPDTEAERSYLGVGNMPTLSIEDIEAELILIEIVGVYCPKCHQQFPKMKKLFYQIRKDKQLSGRVKFLSIAVGANSLEVDFLKKQFELSYPVVTDPKFEIHKILGEPRTPFTMLVTRDRKIVYTHLGPVEDFDKFLAEIRKLAG